jgi:lysophospholipase L1-like esterase
VLVVLYSLVLCIISIIGYDVYKNNYARVIDLRLSPLLENVNDLNTNGKYWLLGDSRVSQWELPDSIIPKSDLCNLGVDGQTSAQVLYRMELYYKKNTPRYLFLQVGINDLKAIGVFPGRETDIINHCVQNIKLMLSESLDRGITPIFLTIIPPGDVELLRRPVWSNSIKQAVITVNDEMKKYARMHSILMIDACLLLSDSDCIVRKDLQKDCLHLNKKGYEILNTGISEIISKLKKDDIDIDRHMQPEKQ